VLDAWRDRDLKTLGIANAEFQKLKVEEKQDMVKAIRDAYKEARLRYEEFEWYDKK
jgi:hypothetical protein